MIAKHSSKTPLTLHTAACLLTALVLASPVRGADPAPTESPTPALPAPTPPAPATPAVPPTPPEPAIQSEVPTPTPPPLDPAPAQPSPAPTPPAPRFHEMDPVLRKRYGLPPAAEATPPPASPPQYRMDPALMKRYGLIPSAAAPTPPPPSDTPEEFLKRGLFEEEANRKPDEAVPQYEAVIRLHDAQRRNTATALFRLAECQRKLGRNDAAISSYQRLLRDFSDHADLVDLARPRLDDLQPPAPPAPTPATLPSRQLPVRLPAIAGITPPAPANPQAGMGPAGMAPGQPSGPPQFFVRDPVTGQVTVVPGDHQGTPRIFLPPPLAALDPSELPELERQLAFIESKRNQGPEVFASAIRLVFSTDRPLARLEKLVQDLTHTVATRKVFWDEADANVKKWSDMLAEAQRALAEIERSGAGKSKSPVPEFDVAIKRVANIQSVIKDYTAKASERGYHERLLARQREELSARREHLIRTARLKIELLRALQTAPTFEARLDTTLKHLRAARNPADRSELVLLTLADDSLRGLWTRLASEEERAIDLQAKAPRGDSPDASTLKAAELSLASYRQSIVEREDELLRSNELSLELARAQARDEAGAGTSAPRF